MQSARVEESHVDCEEMPLQSPEPEAAATNLVAAPPDVAQESFAPAQQQQPPLNGSAAAVPTCSTVGDEVAQNKIQQSDEGVGYGIQSDIASSFSGERGGELNAGMRHETWLANPIAAYMETQNRNA